MKLSEQHALYLDSNPGAHTDLRDQQHQGPHISKAWRRHFVVLDIYRDIFLCVAFKLFDVQGISTEDVTDAIVNSKGPKTQATKAEYVKFHDDKSTYTGVYAK